jgi:hypothetical protein
MGRSARVNGDDDDDFRCTSANLLFSLVTFRGQVIIVRLSMHFCHDLSHVSSCSIIGISTVHIFNFVFIDGSRGELIA